MPHGLYTPLPIPPEPLAVLAEDCAGWVERQLVTMDVRDDHPFLTARRNTPDLLEIAVVNAAVRSDDDAHTGMGSCTARHKNTQ